MVLDTNKIDIQNSLSADEQIRIERFWTDGLLFHPVNILGGFPMMFQTDPV
jgi:hypothetical protein